MVRRVKQNGNKRNRGISRMLWKILIIKEEYQIENDGK